ncbi:MAG: cytochrome ubiquinol oxidase subunit I [Methylomonas sp.]
MISETVVELSRWQYAITAIFHFLFIPLTLGLSVLLALMESIYVSSGLAAYKTMCHFWGRIFAVSFILEIATRLTMVFQFGMNGSYFSHYFGDAFALPLAIEAFSVFFLGSLLFGPYLFGWERFGKRQHLLITWLLALAVNASALWVLIANGWMQNPVGAVFNYQSFRIELTDFAQMLSNPVAISKATHTIPSSYAIASATVLAISAWLLMNRHDDEMARNSFRLAAPLGLAALLTVIGLGDATPHQDNPVQNRKLAVINGDNLGALLPEIETRIRSGIKAYALLDQLRDNNKDPQLLADFEQHKADLGYAWLLKRWTEHIGEASDKQVKLAAQTALPGYPRLIYWVYRLMLACGVLTLLWFILAVWRSVSRQALQPWLLKLSVYLLPVPWLASIAGWFVSEAGKQPWAIAELLPTFLSVSSLSVKELIFSAILYAITYGALLIIGLFLVRQTIQTHLSGQTQGALQ